MCPAKQFALTHVVIFVLCACKAADRLSVHCGHFLSDGGSPPKARMIFCTAVGSEEKLFSAFCFGLAAAGVKNRNARKVNHNDG